MKRKGEGVMANMTLRELQPQIEPAKGKKAPTKAKLLKSGELLDTFGPGKDTYMVFKSGFAVASYLKRTTVFRIDECRDYTYDIDVKELGGEDSATPAHIDEEFFLDKPWALRLLLTAEDNFQKNGDNRTDKWLGEHPEIVENVFDMGAYQSAEDIVIAKEEKERLLGVLTEKQREAFILYYDYGYKLHEAAEILGVGKIAIFNRLDGALKRIREAITSD